ncbi:MAG: DNA polymerase III subunit epsilon [Burkholderia sp.]|nr:DNA polymerase III subunit epsilon [Burkholderia sp.]
MRQIILDTETTGLNVRTGDRIIEIGCIELLNRQITSNNLHLYINPERDSDPAAFAVHGLTTKFLSNKPKFSEIASQLRNFLNGAELIIHNALFDIRFLDAEFKRLKLSSVSEICSGVIDTLVQAKKMFPGKRNSLDALCDRFEIKRSHRTLHSALLDSELLAGVYIAMTRGQDDLSIDVLDSNRDDSGKNRKQSLSLESLDLQVLYATGKELEEHNASLDIIEKMFYGSCCLWRKHPRYPLK